MFPGVLGCLLGAGCDEQAIGYRTYVDGADVNVGDRKDRAVWENDISPIGDEIALGNQVVDVLLVDTHTRVLLGVRRSVWWEHTMGALSAKQDAEGLYDAEGKSPEAWPEVDARGRDVCGSGRERWDDGRVSYSCVGKGLMIDCWRRGREGRIREGNLSWKDRRRWRERKEGGELGRGS